MHSPVDQNRQRPTKPDLTPPAAPRPEAVQLRARRSPRLIALGVLLVALGGLGAAYLFTLNSNHHSLGVGLLSQKYLTFPRSGPLPTRVPKPSWARRRSRRHGKPVRTWSLAGTSVERINTRIYIGLS